MFITLVFVENRAECGSYANIGTGYYKHVEKRKIGSFIDGTSIVSECFYVTGKKLAMEKREIER